MDKRLKITEIAARTQLSISTVSRVLAGKANTRVVFPVRGAVDITAHTQMFDQFMNEGLSN